MAQDPLLSQDQPGDSFQDEEESVHIPLWQQQRRGSDETSSSSSSVSTALLGEVLSSEEEINENGSPKLPLALVLSYCLCGLTMSLPTLPIMYILNSKVPLPLSVLPIYGSLSFLPYSFKPFYAYLSSFFQRRILLLIGWTTCALTTLAWMWVPSVPCVFLVGIANSIAMSWSSFLLGLTLIDTARALFLSSSSSSTTCSFEKAGALFQSQAATARNIGSFTASGLTCLVFGMNTHQTTTFSPQLVNGIFWATAGCQMINCLLVLSCPDSFAPTIQLQRSCPVEPQQQSSRPSYASLSLEVDHPTEEDEESSETNSLEADEEPAPSSSFCHINVLAIVGLQILIILLALKHQVASLMQQHTMVVPVLAILSMLLFAFLFLRIYCTNHLGDRIVQQVRKSWGRSHMVGLVLILRHAVPNPSAVLYSFLYHCFESQPLWLQVFSLVDNGIVTLASWSYQKLWAPHYNQGRKLIAFMMISTVVAQSTGILYTVVVHYYEEGESLSLKSLFPWLVLAVKAVNTFVSEWNFLPSVVLATVSVSAPSASEEFVHQHHNSRDPVTDECGDEQPEPLKVKPNLSTNVMYGSFVSCIDFGDQIGSMLCTPLVAALGITRESSWHNLDSLIGICSGLGVLSVGFLLLLVWQLPEPPERRRRRQVFGLGNVSQA